MVPTKQDLGQGDNFHTKTFTSGMSKTWLAELRGSHHDHVTRIKLECKRRPKIDLLKTYGPSFVWHHGAIFWWQNLQTLSPKKSPVHETFARSANANSSLDTLLWGSDPRDTIRVPVLWYRGNGRRQRTALRSTLGEWGFCRILESIAKNNKSKDKRGPGARTLSICLVE